MEKQNINQKEPMNEVKFADGSVPVAVAARVYGKEAHWVRAGIINRNSYEKGSGCKNYKRNGFKIW